MSLEYYLNCRDKYERMINYLDYIIDMWEDVNNIQMTELINDNNIENIFQSENNIFFIEKKNYILNLKLICDKKIEDLCDHVFEDDLIDITPDKSKYITYCKICGYTK